MTCDGSINAPRLAKARFTISFGTDVSHQHDDVEADELSPLLTKINSKKAFEGERIDVKYYIFLLMKVTLYAASTTASLIFFIYGISKLRSSDDIVANLCNFSLDSLVMNESLSIPFEYTCDIETKYWRYTGAALNNPPFVWSCPPDGTKEFMFTLSTLVGPGSPGEGPDYKYDWCLYNIPSTMQSIPTGVYTDYNGVQFCGSYPPDPDTYYYYLDVCPTSLGQK